MGKHIFVVHSGITCISWLSICNHLNIDTKDTLVLSSRGWSKILMNWDVSLISWPSIAGIRIRSNILGYYRCIKLFDKAIRDATNGSTFHLYIPHSIVPRWQLLSSHKLCSGFSYIEEGSVNYKKHYDKFFPVDDELFQQSNIDRLLPENVLLTSRDGLRRRGIDRYLPKNAFILSKKLLAGRINHTIPFDDRADFAYGLFPESFMYTKLRCIEVKPVWKNIIGEKSYDNIIVVALMPVYTTSKLCRLDYHLYALHEVTRILANQKKKIVIKFHPDEAEEHCTLIMNNIFTQFEMELSLAPDDIPLEIILENNDVDLLHSMSSLGIYATKYNRRIYTYTQLIGDLDRDFHDLYLQYKNGLAIDLDEIDVRKLV